MNRRELIGSLLGGVAASGVSVAASAVPVPRVVPSGKTFRLSPSIVGRDGFFVRKSEQGGSFGLVLFEAPWPDVNDEIVFEHGDIRLRGVVLDVMVVERLSGVVCQIAGTALPWRND